MPAFAAINLEPEEPVDEEVDTAREVQIDEAFKQFQQALKLHSQGPRFYDEAEEAYGALFKSEIFKFPDAATDFERSEARSLELDSQDPDSILPQALYLSYKNRGLFLLDQIRHQAKTAGANVFEQPHAIERARRVLNDFSNALDCDPSDAELWRRAARIASYLNHGRINRYCLEAAIEMDDDPTVVNVEPPSIAEALAGNQLLSYLSKLHDNLSLSHPVMQPWANKKVLSLLAKYLDPVPYLPNPANKVCAAPTTKQAEPSSSRLISVPEPSWASVGRALVDYVDQNGTTGERILLQVPDFDESEDEDTQESHGPTEAESDDAEAAEQKAGEAQESETQEQEQDRRRKRSQSLAGLADEEAEHKRSKRVRRRETLEEVTDPSTLIAAQLAPCQRADQILFQMTNVLLEDLGGLQDDLMARISEILDGCATEDRTKTDIAPAILLRDSITSYSEDKARVLLGKKDASNLGNLTSMLEHCKVEKGPEFRHFKEKHLKDFVTRVNSHSPALQDVVHMWLSHTLSTYTTSKWSDALRLTVVDLLARFDEDLWQSSPDDGHIVQTIFEIHLDAYEKLVGPRSAAETSTKLEAKYRLDRWLEKASAQERTIRFLWSAVLSVQLKEQVCRDFLLHAWSSVRDHLEDQILWLPNNSAMPEVSRSAAEREISKLTTMDFFASLRGDMEPVATIESLEPILNPGICRVGDRPIEEVAPSSLRDIWKVVARSSTELRLFLWDTLANAYRDIEYTTKQFSCHLRALEMLVSDLESSDCSLKLFRYIDDLLVPALSAAINDPTAFDILDEYHTRDSAAALTKLACVLHTVALIEDEHRVGISQPPTAKSFDLFIAKLRELQVRTWSLLYRIFKSSTEFEVAEYLSAIHRVLGLRKSCRCSNKVFLKLMRNELIRRTELDNWGDHMAQVLYDMYGIKFGFSAWDVQDHGCPPEKLERRTAMLLSERVIELAENMPMKDLLKSDLKSTIEHMQTAIGQTKSSSQMILNIRKFNDTLRRPIHPLHLYKAFTGIIAVDAVTIKNADSSLARHGWFFLLGLIALSKFKAIDLNKRQTPGAIDDLRMATTFIRQQLQFTPEKWEAWYRLGECHDYELDEMVLWSAEKMNKEREDLVQLQRMTIHCYTLAISCAANNASPGDEDALYELHLRFAMRLYASSREPFAMEAFEHPEQERYFIQAFSGTFKRIIHSEMTPLQVWKYAAALFKRAMAARPEEWLPPYMLAKCLWKMGKTQRLVAILEKAVEAAGRVKRPRGSDPILEPAYKLVSIVDKMVTSDRLPRKDGWEILGRQPFLKESIPCFKGSDMHLDEWKDTVISALRCLRDLDKAGWQHRIVARHARILLNDDCGHGPRNGGNLSQGKAAFSVLRDNMFTKTMVMNVWKCDAERPGRHFVFMEEYVRLIVNILHVLKDRANLEALLRRMRKRGADFYHFSELWQSCCMKYLGMIREAHEVSTFGDEGFRSTSLDEFELIAARITTWAEEGGQHALLGAMKEAYELKKLNGNLMKGQVIDELVSDCFTDLWMDIKTRLPGPGLALVLEERQKKVKEAEARTAPEKQGNQDPNQEKRQDSAGPSEKPGDSTTQNLKPRRTAVRRQEILRAAERTIMRSTGYKAPGVRIQ